MERKGLVLAGGLGSRLYPVTLAVSKQLLPVFDKPMIYYSLSVLMLAKIKEIGIILTPETEGQFRSLLGNGSQWGIELSYIIQEKPEGIAQAYILAEKFLDNKASLMILGDNIFYGGLLSEMLKQAKLILQGATIFSYRVSDPQRYGVISFKEDGNIKDLVEKPKEPPSDYAITGLYFLDHNAPKYARNLKPSARGELEITELLKFYLRNGSLKVKKMNRGFAWLDTGEHDTLLDASNFVRALQKRQGLQIGSPDEVALQNQWISRKMFEERLLQFENTEYGKSLKRVNLDS